MAAVADESSDVFFLVSVVAPLLFCCFAIFVCALNSIWKTRSKLEALTQVAKQREPTEYTEFTIDLTTKMDSCVELSSPQISSKEESVLL
ncbi:Protein CBG14098 [Caenorhabditis briggsae]|uniref:Protein CBG14098 n=2 Tax=Caenorhabditis TaxID=6237 RepID=A8XJB9_CAEBR|nr:Protein CBG14098 [Caenorhabditis briggsae]CAP32744.2 Protein CBG14098 [Caenorhabditis briggsae]